MEGENKQGSGSIDAGRDPGNQMLGDKSRQGGVGDFVARAGWIFTAPSRVFSDIERGAVSWWQPWIWVGIISAITAYLSLPIQRVVVRLNPNNLPEEQLERVIENMEQFGVLGIVIAPVAVLVVSLIISLIGYILVSILASLASFKRFFTIYLYASIVGNVGVLISILIVRFVRGVETIRSAQDASFNFGLGFLAPPDNRFLEAVFKNIDLFSIWTLVLIAMGLMQIFKVPRNQAIICVIPLWLISVVMMVIGAMFGGG